MVSLGIKCFMHDLICEVNCHLRPAKLQYGSDGVVCDTAPFLLISLPQNPLPDHPLNQKSHKNFFDTHLFSFLRFLIKTYLF